MQTKWGFAGSTDMWSTSAGGHLMKVVNLTGFTVYRPKLATLKAVSFYLLHNVSTEYQCRNFSCVTVVCKHFASYQDHPNYKWNLI
jgi:hypothetical protein